jgi:glycosyltransferase involved in cell wall biosynthesis
MPTGCNKIAIMTTKKKIVLLGPAKNAVSGVSTHLNQLFCSDLSDQYTLLHFQVGSEGREENPLAALWRYLSSPFALLVYLLRNAPDVVHVNSSLEPKSYWRDLVYVLVGKIAGTKLIYQVHGGELPEQFLGTSAFARRFLRWSLELPDAIVLLAEVEREAYSRFGNIKNIAVIPNAIELADYEGLAPKLFDKNRIVLGYIGRLADDKGIKESLLALSALKAGGKADVKFVIAGSGPIEGRLRSMVAEEGLEDIVEFVAPVFGAEKIRFWKEIDLFMFPTYHREGLPYTVLEAIASGTPVITTRVGGIPDVIQDGKQGVFVEAPTPEAIAGTLMSLLQDRQGLREMSAAGADRAREFYHVHRLAAQFSKLYREVLQ